MGNRVLTQGTCSGASDNSQSAAIVICVEKGMLEYKALCLVLTLRRNWKHWANTPIYSYSPRKDRGISPWLAEIFKANGVNIIEEPLNTKYEDYPLANKPICMANAEAQLEHELLIFLDSDILCWNPPTHFNLPLGYDLSMVADTTKSVASAGPSDPYDKMWRELYSVFGSEIPPVVTTTLTEERVQGWWGSGVFAVRRRSGLMARWYEGFGNALSSVKFDPAAVYLREQMTLCALAVAVQDRFLEMPVTHNFPVQNYPVFEKRGINANDVVLWHYQPFFNKAFRTFGQRLEKLSLTSAKEKAALGFINDLNVNFRTRIGLDESLVASWRKKLRLGPRIRSFKKSLFQ